MRRRRRVFTRTTPSAVRRTARHVHRERILWAPILIGITVGVAAVITGWVGPDRWILTTYALGVLLLLLGVWRGYRDDPAELVYGIVCVVTGAVWTVAVWTGFGQPWDQFWSLVVATLLLGFFWWNNDREHARVKIEKERRAWPELVKGTGLARTVLGQKTRTAVGWTAVLWWHPGEFSVRRALDAAEDLEGLNNAPAGSITVKKIGREANMVRVQCVEEDPHVEPIRWDGAVLARVADRVDLGLFPDGSPLATQWWQPGVGGHHKLLAGMTRCLSGDTAIVVNRAGNGRSYQLRDLVAAFNGEPRFRVESTDDAPTQTGQCAVPGCDNIPFARSWCAKHYQRWAKWGDPLVSKLGKSDWDLSIPTYVQREVDGVVRLARLRAAWSSGVQITYTVTTDSGRTIRATDQHPFLTDRGWVKLGDLTPGDRVHVRGQQASTAPTKPKSWYRHVHHRNEDPHDNDPANLMVLTAADHRRHHADDWMRHVLYKVDLETVTAIERYGEEETFDLEIEDDPHNFIADGFVVHNSGKSTLMRLLVCLYGPAEDAVHWMIDLKGGMALTPVAPLSDWFATKPEKAVAMLAAAVRIIEARAEESARRRWEVWQASPAFPVLIIHVDELARLTGIQAAPRIAAQATPLITDIMQLGAGVGVLFSGATQYALVDAVGSSQLREQFGWTACFRMRSEGTSVHFLPNAPRGIEPAHIPDDRKGTCYVDAMGEFRPDPARICMITDEEVDSVVRAWWDRTPELDQVSRNAAGPDYAARDIHTPDGTAGRDMTDEPDNPTEDPVTPEPDNRTPQPDTGPTLAELAQAELERMTPEQRRAELAARTKALSERADGSPDTARGILMQLLAEAGPDGVFPRDVRAACCMSESWVFRALRELREQGRAELNPDGRTRLLRPDVDRVRTGAGSSLR